MGFDMDIAAMSINMHQQQNNIQLGTAVMKMAMETSEEGSEYYFFCHDSDGTPYYASTMDEHLMNMAEAGLL